VMGIGLAHDFETFLIFRLLIGCIGASFVITQYHTSVMFAPNCIGTASATSAGWGNLGGGVTQLAMPLVFALFVGGLGFSTALGWRASMVTAGVVCLLTGLAYYRFTQDAPDGNFKQLRAEGKMPAANKSSESFPKVCKDYRVWALFVIYGACFGLELTMCNVAALYFADFFGLSIAAAGMTAAAFGLMNLFARTLGGAFADRFGSKWGLRGRAMWLFMTLFCEGLALMLFSQMRALVPAITLLIMFSIFVKMAQGATFSIVPFINKKALGPVAGIVGAGGNAGAVAAGFLFKSSIAWPTALLILGGIVTATSLFALALRFAPEVEADHRRTVGLASQERNGFVPTQEPAIQNA
jgi:NNP family nitrate/nitrite transporter-like MFS transporter